MAFPNGYSYRKALTVDHTKVAGGADLSSFPVLVSRTDAALATVANGGKVQSATGLDIRFELADGTKLDHEVELWKATTGQLVAWVRIPTLSASVDTPFYLYYGNASVVASEQNKTGVWSAATKFVLHGGDGTTLSAADSTSNNATPTNHGATAAAGEVSGALAFAKTSSQYVDYGNGGATANVHQAACAFEFWINPAGTLTGTILGQSDNDAVNSGWFIDLGTYDSHPAGVLAMWHEGSGGDMRQEWARPTTGAWTHVVILHDGSLTSNAGTQCYYNGVLQTQLGGHQGSGTNGTNTAIPFQVAGNIGRTASGTFDGALDEIRIYGATLTAGWIATDYAAQSSPSTFYSVGGEELPPAGASGSAGEGESASGTATETIAGTGSAGEGEGVTSTAPGAITGSGAAGEGESAGGTGAVLGAWQGVRTITDSSQGIDISFPYQVFLPKGWSAAGALWPVATFLHGSGERGTDGSLQLTAFNPAAAPTPGVDLNSIANFPAIVIAPQYPSAFPLAPATTYLAAWRHLLATALPQLVASQYHGDTSRLSLTGLSMGAENVYGTIHQYPEVFAGAGIVSGDLAPLSDYGGATTLAQALPYLTAGPFGHTHSHIYHAHDDGTIAVTVAEQISTALINAGAPCTYTEAPDGSGGHSLTYWDTIYGSSAFWTELTGQQLDVVSSGAAGEGESASGTGTLVDAASGNAGEGESATGSGSVSGAGVTGNAGEGESAAGSGAVAIAGTGTAGEGEGATGSATETVAASGSAAEAESASGTAGGAAVSGAGSAGEGSGASGAAGVLDPASGSAGSGGGAAGSASVTVDASGTAGEGESAAAAGTSFTPGAASRVRATTIVRSRYAVTIILRSRYRVGILIS